MPSYDNGMQVFDRDDREEKSRQQKSEAPIQTVVVQLDLFVRSHLFLGFFRGCYVTVTAF